MGTTLVHCRRSILRLTANISGKRSLSVILGLPIVLRSKCIDMTGR